MLEHRSQGSLRLLHADTWTQASHHLQPVLVLVEIQFRCDALRGVKRHVGMNWKVEIRGSTRIHTEKFWFGDSHQGHGDIVYLDSLSRGILGSAKMPLT